MFSVLACPIPLAFNVSPDIEREWQLTSQPACIWYYGPARRQTGELKTVCSKTGGLFLKLRADYQRKMGRSLSLQDFHDRFIKAGSPPVKIVRRELMGRDGPLL